MDITRHAYQRAKERCGLNKKALSHLLSIAMDKGLKQGDCKGSLSKWVNHVYCTYRNGTHMRIYGEYLFICDDRKLITIYLIPNNLKKSVKILIDKKNKEKKC